MERDAVLWRLDLEGYRQMEEDLPVEQLDKLRQIWARLVQHQQDCKYCFCLTVFNFILNTVVQWCSAISLQLCRGLLFGFGWPERLFIIDTLRSCHVLLGSYINS